LPDLPVVLLVEDDEPLQLVLHDGLKDGGFDVLVVASAREALALLQSGVVKYSALVTDIKLADGQKGWDVARRAREIDSSLVVVYASSASADDWRAQGVPNSILLGKPFAPAQLLTAVSQLLNGNDRAGPNNRAHPAVER
jgi:DNA-binding response OmpR family regulator